MSMIYQYILVIIIFAGAAGYGGYLVYRRFSKKRRTNGYDCLSNPCEGCEGCSLKQELREKSCPKDLFPPK